MTGDGQQNDGKRQPRLTLWGASQSGKTTYLAASLVAALRADDPWRVAGMDDASSHWLREQTNVLLSKRFPPSTVTMSQCRLAWSYDPRKPRLRRGPKEVAFEVDVLDAPAALFREPEEEHSDQWWWMLDHVLACDGLIYLYDPLQEKEQREARQRPLIHLCSRALEKKLTQEGRLPHILAVCVAKYDHPKIFRDAQQWTTQGMGPSQNPLPTDPKKFFEDFADPETKNTISRYFHPDRTGYFVTSAIGFFRGRKGEIAWRSDDHGNAYPDSYANVVKGPDGSPMIRGEVWPVNVVEPWQWVQQQLEGEKGRRR